MARKGRRVQDTRGRKLWLGLAVGLVVAGAGAAVWVGLVGEASAACEPTGLHEHAAFGVYVRNESVTWASPGFDFPRTGSLAAHLHMPNAHTLHMEGGPRDCVTVAQAFQRALLTTLTPTSLELDKGMHGGAAYRDGEGGELRFFLGDPPESWKESSRRTYVGPENVTWSEVPDLPERQPYDGQYLLVTFGDEDEAAIRWQQLSIPRPNGAE